MAEAVATRELTYVGAIAEAAHTVLAEQDTAFVAGEDVAGAGGVFGSYRGLLDAYGEERVIDTPISEEGIVGLAVGAAATGLRPVIDIMFMDFMGECMDEIANQMAKMRYMFGGSASLPITIITMSGGGMNMAAQHSQSLEAWICHLPGLKVVAPATPHDAKGLIIAASRDDNPVFVVLNKLSLRNTGEVPEESYEVPIGKARTAREGSDLTIVTYSRMVHEATTAAEALAEEGIDTEVIDLRSLQPWTPRRGLGAEDPSRHRRPRGGALRRARRRDRLADSGTRVRLAGRAGGTDRCTVLAGAVRRQPRAAWLSNAPKIVAAAKELLGSD